VVLPLSGNFRRVSWPFKHSRKLLAGNFYRFVRDRNGVYDCAMTISFSSSSRASLFPTPGELRALYLSLFLSLSRRVSGIGTESKHSASVCDDVRRHKIHPSRDCEIKTFYAQLSRTRACMRAVLLRSTRADAESCTRATLHFQLMEVVNCNEMAARAGETKERERGRLKHS